MSAIKWSYSTINTFRQCNRKFYFASILASFGRKDALRRKAYELKSMQNLKMWAGTVVDKFMTDVVIPAMKRKEELHFDALAEQAVKMAEAQFRFSKNGFYKDNAIKKGEAGDFCILDIHEVKRPYTEDQILECYQKIRTAILNIPNIKMPNGAALVKYLLSADILSEDVRDRSVLIEKARVSPQIDLLAYVEWKPVIIDWKLSSSYTSDYARQLAIAGVVIYLNRKESDKKDFSYQDVQLFEVNLLTGIVKQHEFNEEIVHDLINYINLTGSDISLLTKEKVEAVDIEDFEMTDEEAFCKNCNFQTLCSYLLTHNNEYDEKLFSESIQA